jgi:hypothetical protein
MTGGQPPRLPSAVYPIVCWGVEIGWGSRGSERVEGGEEGCQRCLNERLDDINQRLFHRIQKEANDLGNKL